VLFGGAPGVTTSACDILRARYPGADLLAVAAPEVGADGAMPFEVVEELRELRADLVCVALGNPKQERWIERHRATVGASVFIGVGGTLDFVVGRTKRAPMRMRRAGLEWLHRAWSEPRRLLKRYARDIVVFVPRAVAQAARGRLVARRAPHPTLVVRRPVSTSDGRDEVIDGTATPPAFAVRGPAVVSPAGDDRDPRLVAAVATVVRTARRAGQDVTLDGASRALLDRAGVPR
jgi:N-acetylglucosaminyldiphosphoundecaprenol N-acetyl-beta-D-mannosaminyltransferase